MNGRNRVDIKIGDLVDIVLKSDQKTGALTRGRVSRILTKGNSHPHAIKVILDENCEVGRVVNIIESNHY